jgi:hypothetical protein
MFQEDILSENGSGSVSSHENGQSGQQIHQQYNRISHGQAACAALDSQAREPDRRCGAPQLRIRHVQVFADYYRTNHWACAESASGPGSTLEYTEQLRLSLAKIVEDYRIGCVLDAPCGDYNWFRLVELPPGTKYIGGDIVEALVAVNLKKYGTCRSSFRVMDITRDALPAADLWLCRDCWIHLPNRDIRKAIANFEASKIRLIATTTYPDVKGNPDILVGGFRPLNLEIPPFNWCKPLCYLHDSISGWPNRKLGLWDRNMLQGSAAADLIGSVHPC